MSRQAHYLLIVSALVSSPCAFGECISHASSSPFVATCDEIRKAERHKDTQPSFRKEPKLIGHDAHFHRHEARLEEPTQVPLKARGEDPPRFRPDR